MRPARFALKWLSVREKTMGPLHEIMGRRMLWTILGIIIVAVAVIGIIIATSKPQSAAPLPSVNREVSPAP